VSERGKTIVIWPVSSRVSLGGITEGSAELCMATDGEGERECAASS
jgi:hypothetical protein